MATTAGHYGDHFGGVNAPSEVVVGAKNGVGADGTATTGGGGYPLLPVNVVRFNVDRGDGLKGTLAIPSANDVAENVSYGDINSPTVGKLRAADRLWYLSGGPPFGVVGNLQGGDALMPGTEGIVKGYTSRKNGISSDGRYVPPARSYYLSTGPGYDVDGLTMGTATSGGAGGPLAPNLPGGSSLVQ